MVIGTLACLLYTSLNDIAVAAGGKQVFAVGRDVEVAGMDAGGLITYLCQGDVYKRQVQRHCPIPPTSSPRKMANLSMPSVK